MFEHCKNFMHILKDYIIFLLIYLFLFNFLIYLFFLFFGWKCYGTNIHNQWKQIPPLICNNHINYNYKYSSLLPCLMIYRNLLNPIQAKEITKPIKLSILNLFNKLLRFDDWPSIVCLMFSRNNMYNSE